MDETFQATPTKQNFGISDGASHPFDMEVPQTIILSKNYYRALEIIYYRKKNLAL